MTHVRRAPRTFLSLPRLRGPRRLSFWITWSLVGGVVGLLVAGFALSVAADRLWFGPPRLIPYELHEIRDALPSETLVVSREGEPLGALFAEEHRRWIEYGDLPPGWVEAVVAIEDSRFWTHTGVDVKGVVRAARRNLGAGEVVEGASTLTMQVVDNLGAGGNTLRRKAIEAREAAALERSLEKWQILEIYSNLFHVTGNGSGLEVAARYFFDRPAADLGLVQSAFLAGTLHAPARYDVFADDPDEIVENVERAVARTRTVLERMESVDPAQIDRLLDGLAFTPGAVRFAQSSVMARVRRELEGQELGLALMEAGIDNVATAGLRIETSLDARLQRTAESALRATLDDLRDDVTHPSDPEAQVEGGLVAMSKGRIVALVGGYDSENDYRVGTAMRQPGSLAKVPLYALALGRGWQPDDLLENTRVTLRSGKDLWSPAGGGPPESSFADALLYSRNQATAWLLAHLYDKVDDDEVLRIARDLDFLRAPGESRREWKDRLLAAGIRPDLDAQREQHRANQWRRLFPKAGEGRRGLRGPRRRPGSIDPSGRFARAWDGEGDELESEADGTYRTDDRDDEAEADDRDERFLRPRGLRRRGLRPRMAGAWRPPAPILAPLPGGDDPWAIDNLALDPTFRLAVAVEELRGVMVRAGLEEPPAVPSIVLGSAETTVLRQTAMIQSLVTGEAWSAIDGEPAGLVQRVFDAQGRLIWSAEPRALAAAGHAPSTIRDILTEVTVRGTAGRVRRLLRDERGVPFALPGKTGTSDRYQDASFVGVVDRPDGPLAIGVRVGFDQPAPMLRSSGEGVAGGVVAPVVAEVARAALTTAPRTVASRRRR